MKKVLLVIASKDFRDEELFHTKEEIEKKGNKVVIASTTKSEVKGMLGGVATPDILLDSVNVEDYNAIIFIGGMGSSEYWESKKAHQILNQAYKENKLVGAICIAPTTLLNAGLLNGTKFNSWESEVEKIKENGGIHEEKSVVVDKNVITANGPDAARSFGQKISELI
jgi:protease I